MARTERWRLAGWTGGVPAADPAKSKLGPGNDAPES